jgi:RNA polymerase sigma-70 factor (ECF subfamily)
VEITLAHPAPTADRELLLRAQAGEAEAFGELVQVYMRRAYYAALGLVGNHDDALDLSQEAFVRAFRARNRIDAERPFYTWFYQILRRLCFNHLRNRRTRSAKLRQASDWLADQAENRAPAEGPQRAMERAERILRVQRAMAGLREHEREILILKEFEGLKYREIADLLGIPIGTVMSRLYAARHHLADRLEDES